MLNFASKKMHMERKLSYDISYSQLNVWRRYENWVLYLSIGCTIVKVAASQFGIETGLDFIYYLGFISLVLYGILYVIVEIFLQPRVATERQKGLLDNSLGTKLLIDGTEGYFDNDNNPIGAKKLLVNTFENCFFTYNIMKKMLPKVATCNIILFVVLLAFAYFGYQNNYIAMALLQLFFSTVFFRRLMHHVSFCLRLKELQEQFIHLFSSHSVTEKELEDNGYYFTLMYETALAYNKAPNSDKVYENSKEELNKKWAVIKKRYGI